MNNEKTITICGKEVKMRYCAATETGFEQLAGKSIGNIKFDEQYDLIRLCVASMIAAYECNGEDCPIESKEILYNAKPSELVEMFKTILELRAAWYEVPLVLKEQIEKEQADQKDEDKQKNA